MKRLVSLTLRTTVVTLLWTGLSYPLLVTGLAHVLFPHQAQGSLLQDAQGRVVGSKLVGQAFPSPAYFHTRPSSAGPHGYDGLASAGSNLGPTSQKLREEVGHTLDTLLRANPDARGPVPVELLTRSGSGLDPHLSPQAARWQVPRVAKARKVAPERVERVVEAQLEGRELWILGEPRVNVLALNLALDRQFGPPPQPPLSPSEDERP